MQYNTIDYQGDPMDTCGRHVVFFLRNNIEHNIDLSAYYHYILGLKRKCI